MIPSGRTLSRKYSVHVWGGWLPRPRNVWKGEATLTPYLLTSFFSPTSFSNGLWLSRHFDDRGVSTEVSPFDVFTPTFSTTRIFLGVRSIHESRFSVSPWKVSGPWKDNYRLPRHTVYSIHYYFAGPLNIILEQMRRNLQSEVPSYPRFVKHL